MLVSLFSGGGWSWRVDCLIVQNVDIFFQQVVDRPRLLNVQHLVLVIRGRVA